MISQRPYFIRAMYEWILDNEWTPYIQVDADWPGVEVPRQFVEDGVIVLNIGPTATHQLKLGNDLISFRARFQGQDQRVVFPPGAVLSIFARETGMGMPFPAEQYPESPQPRESAEAEAREKADKTHKVVPLKRVK